MARGGLLARAKWLLLVVALVGYFIVTYHMAGLPPTCPTLAEQRRGSATTPPPRPPTEAAPGAVDPGRAVTAPPAAVDRPEAGARGPGPEALSHDVLLDPRLAPNTVYYVWCGKRWFEFNHYVAVLSVLRYVRPDNVVFYYDTYPVLDQWMYNTWFDELVKQYPFFRPRQLEASERGCEGDSAAPRASMFFVQGLLSTRGGMYVNEHTVFPEFPIALRRLDLAYGVTSAAAAGSAAYAFLLAQRGFPGKYTVEEMRSDGRWKTRNYTCPTLRPESAVSEMPFCFALPHRLFPKDIWGLRSAFGRTVRKIFYDDERVPTPKKSYDELVPNIAHIVWIGGGEMDFLFYLCVLSLIYVAKVDMVYIHGDAPPAGDYWRRVKDNAKVTLVYRETPKMVYGNRVEVISHVTDVWRVDFMLKYGGIYVDTDTAFVRPLDREIRAYDAVATYDWTYWNHPFPDTINFGVSIGKRNATFWHRFQESMRWFVDRDWAWNGLRQPYRITERHPTLALIDPRMQVTCYLYKCHPTWWPDYHNESVHHLNSASITDWRTQLYAFHWTLPTPPELLNERNLAKSNTMFSEVARFILDAAGRKID